MPDPLRLAVIGVGRIGIHHARHLQELSAERGDCRLVAVADRYAGRADEVVRQLQPHQKAPIRGFDSPRALVEAGVADAVLIASRTADHLDDTKTAVSGGLRILLEKPLADTLPEARELAAWLDADAHRSRAVMLAFQRRYDPAMLMARRLLRAGAIGELFKIVSILEDPAPPPPGYQSPGLLLDMGVHNVDEIIWLAGRNPTAVGGFGSRLHNQRIPGVTVEAFDDAFVQMWLGPDVIAQLQVSRNHVAGYRNECVLFGRKGRIHVGHFEGDPHGVRLEAYGPDHAVIERRTFALRDYGPTAPVFVRRFGSAYEAEAGDFIDRCVEGRPFAVTHREGLTAMRVVAAAAAALATGAPVELP